MGQYPYYFQKSFTFKKNTFLKFVSSDFNALFNLIFIKKPAYFLKTSQGLWGCRKILWKTIYFRYTNFWKNSSQEKHAKNKNEKQDRSQLL